MNIITFLLIGLISGWIASTLVEGRGAGAIRDIILGIIGAFLGGFVFSIIGIAAYGFWGNVLMSVVGAVVFLFLLRVFSRSHGPRSALHK